LRFFSIRLSGPTGGLTSVQTTELIEIGELNDDVRFIAVSLAIGALSACSSGLTDKAESMKPGDNKFGAVPDN